MKRELPHEETGVEEPPKKSLAMEASSTKQEGESKDKANVTTDPKTEIIKNPQGQQEAKEAISSIKEKEPVLAKTEIVILPEQKEESKRDKSKKKKKLILILGYNGLKFIGSQKQPTDVRTVEGEIEKLLFNQGMIAESNFGKLQKICFTRATRTDKKVHAVQNFFSCKLLIDPAIKDMSIYRDRLAAACPPDIKLFTVLEGSKRFNTKLRCSSREYLYYLPSFCLQPKATTAGLAIDALYDLRIAPEQIAKVNQTIKSFHGTHKFHNYTRDIEPKQMQANRHILDFQVKASFQLNGIEFVQFFVKGQSFLYNQIRKMIGMVILICRNSLPEDTIKKSFYYDPFLTPLAPGEGLMLNRVCYDKYNMMKGDTKVDVAVPLADKDTLAEIEAFKKELVGCICQQEKESLVFSKWLNNLEEKKEPDPEEEKECKEINAEEP